MLTPPKGNVDYLPINADGRKIVDAWDPAKDQVSGEECRAYGAVGVMRQPGRLHITWENDNTLRLDADAGTQTRRFAFNQAPGAKPVEPSWQGASTARWVLPSGRQAGSSPQGQLTVTTTRMRPGYVRPNGVPYSADAVLTEHFVRLIDVDTQQYLAVTQMVDDPRYYTQPIVRTLLFRKQPDASGWTPTPCRAG
jgi:hypothetical protein